jgi:hypothetical protein
MTGTTSFQGLGNPEQGFIPLQGMSIGENPSHIQGNPEQASVPLPGYPQGATSTKAFEIPCKVKSPLKVCHQAI